MVEKILMKAGAAVQPRPMMYKALVQTVFLYRSKIWVVTGEMLTVLENFHHRFARQIAVNTARRAGDSGRE